MAKTTDNGLFNVSALDKRYIRILETLEKQTDVSGTNDQSR